MKVEIVVTDGEKRFGGSVVLAEVKPKVGKSPAPDGAPGSTRPNKPAAAIDALYGGGFFAIQRTLGESLEQLGRDGFNFSAPSITMALNAKPYLQRRGSKGSYRFVQKYPQASVEYRYGDGGVRARFLQTASGAGN
jgi:hypothetical protein